MRIWSLHPKYLDRQGLIALWREALLAQKVLAGKTKGYRYHPQLIRFRETNDPLATIGVYLKVLAEEARCRNYRFNESKIVKLPKKTIRVKVTKGQIEYEIEHLLRKLKVRAPMLWEKTRKLKRVRAHPSFRVVSGGVHAWEKIG